MIFEAIEFAARAHAGQFRKQSRVPYIVHPLAVAEILLRHGCSEELAVAGILHDTVEDTRATIDDIRNRFGEQVAELVAGATEPDKRHSWETRKQHTLQLIQTAPSDILLLICADKLHNIQSIRAEQARTGDAVWSKFNRPKDKQQWYYETLVAALERQLNGQPAAAMLAELRTEVAAVFQDST